MNDENREDRRVETRREDDLAASEAAAGMVSTLQDEVDALNVELDSLRAELSQTQSALASVERPPAAPAGNADLRALAATVRQCQRNGHPDAAKHTDALLKALGA